MSKKRKICFVITSKIHYGRSRLILDTLRSMDDIDLQLVVGASAILPQHGDVLSLMRNDGFVHNAQIIMNIEGGNPIAMAKTAGLGIIEFATVYENLLPDMVVVRGDRFEIMSAVVAAAYMNIPIAHIEGGEVTGTIDESVRHAISKFAHVHFVTHEEARERLVRMGEHRDHVHVVGSPDVEFVANTKSEISNEFLNEAGVGTYVDVNKPFVVMMQHPVTTEYDKSYEHTEMTLMALHELGIPAVCFWPNVDAGSDWVSKAMRTFRENKQPQNMRFLKYLSPEMFTALLKKCACLVGNSSSAIKECSYLGVPAVNIGSRQSGRKRAANVIDVPHDKEAIKAALQQQLAHGPYPSSDLYYQENTSKRIAEILRSSDLYVQKKFHE